MIKQNEVLCMDCLTLLNAIDDNSIDLAVVDPPYNMKKAKWDTFNTTDDFLKFTYEWLDILLDKLKANGSLYLFNTPYNAAFILTHLVKKQMLFQNWITWDKRDGIGASTQKYIHGQETILFFTKGKGHTFNHDDIRLPYDRELLKRPKGILKNGKRWYPNPNGKLCSEVWHITSERHKNKVNGKTVKMGHITPKPLDMIERIIKASSNEGDLVLDCFAGSGTTAVAAKKLKRNFICGEINQDYVAISQQRLNEINQTNKPIRLLLSSDRS